MNIKLTYIKIADLVKGYVNSNEDGVLGYGGALDIRPKYQREFVYKEEQRNAVIDTVMRGYPLNVMYWVKREDGTFEVLDGQQRTMSICEYYENNFSVNHRGFQNLTSDEKQIFLNYELTIYQCEGTDIEKFEWFKIVNISGEKLTNQEIRNAVYAGAWVKDAKSYFSKTNAVAVKIGKDYLNGSPIRQAYLQTALDWIYPTENDNEGRVHGSIESYMAMHQHDSHATKLWEYFQSVINWMENIFRVYRREMQGLDWGAFYNRFKDANLDPNKLELEIKALMEDDEVTNKKGIYAYVLTREEKYLSLRAFSDANKRTLFERQEGICNGCKKEFRLDEMEADHIIPWSKGGKTELNNGQMLCRQCNRSKGNKV